MKGLNILSRQQRESFNNQDQYRELSQKKARKENIQEIDTRMCEGKKKTT